MCWQLAICRTCNPCSGRLGTPYSDWRQVTGEISMYVLDIPAHRSMVKGALLPGIITRAVRNTPSYMVVVGSCELIFPSLDGQLLVVLHVINSSEMSWKSSWMPIIKIGNAMHQLNTNGIFIFSCVYFSVRDVKWNEADNLPYPTRIQPLVPLHSIGMCFVCLRIPRWHNAYHGHAAVWKTLKRTLQATMYTFTLYASKCMC